MPAARGTRAKAPDWAKSGSMSRDPREQVLETDGLTQLKPQGTPRTEASVRSADKKLSKERSGEIRKATPEKNLRWCEYEPQDTKASRRQPVEQD